MNDISTVINLSNKLNDLNSKNKANNDKTDDKSDFKSYLSKEVKNNKSETKANSTKNIAEDDVDKANCEEIKVINEEIISEISEKIEKIISSEFLNTSEDLKSESIDEELQEIIFLLVNLIEVNFNNFSISPSEKLDSSKSEGLEEVMNLNFQDDSKITLFNEDINVIDQLSDNNVLPDTKELFNSINTLLVDNLENINSNKSSSDISFNNLETDLLEAVKDLVSILPEKVIKEVENNLDTDISKEIFNSLILKIKNENNEIELNDENQDSLIDIDTGINNNKADVKLIDDFKGNNFIGNNTLKNNSTNKEEEVLLKIIGDDSNQSYANNFNYYDKLNKENPFVEVIKEPVFINKDNINLDFIKNIKYMVKNSVEELKVKIYPKELGEMTIKLISEEGIMKADIKATSKETYNLLNSNLNEIKKTLENQNIRIQEVNIGIYNEDTTFFSGRDSSKESFENQKIDKIKTMSIEEEEKIEALLNESNVNLLA
ncbi:flagellar hook-length control protein FliK [Clostridium sp. AL.422]|uniref:flagellar hook-length control protein FliK n=1 Tax=Clostridium TaxID=1485 RepID=UPI00293DB688|nr:MULTISPECIES: flagellar hook-length control protein FliK [unclassified Clostridium]MDV4149701.1 flagellar hook-length control protein FliK [Clostridium sp. AL.422]